MRLWSIHPSILDRQGLLAAWREGLLAQSVIVRLANGEEPGYRNHPQMWRFLASPVPLCLIGTWLTFIHENATTRGYRFNYSKIIKPSKMFKLPVTDGQIRYEFDHIQTKLKERSENEYWFNYGFYIDGDILPHPMFEVVSGDVAEWEKIPAFSLRQIER